MPGKKASDEAMKTIDRTNKARLRPLQWIAAAATGILLAMAGLSAMALAADDVTTGTVNWGLKQSFRNYISGPIAHGSWEVLDSATDNGGIFGFHSAVGTYDADTGAVEVSVQGKVHFTGHDSGSGPLLDMTIANPTLRITGSTGELLLDVRSKPLDGSDWVDLTQVPFATLDLASNPLVLSDNSISAANIPATLTEEGAAGFAGFYQAGTALDPVSFSVTIQPQSSPSQSPSSSPSESPSSSPSDSPSASPSESPSESPSASSSASPSASSTGSPSGSPSASPSTQGRQTIASGTADWGIKEAFRNYITGNIAHGSWELLDGATETGGLFRFHSAEGTYNDAESTLEASFAGRIRFTGHDYGNGPLLDLTVANPTVRITGGTGELLLDIRSKPLEGGEWTEQTQIRFATLDLTTAQRSARATNGTLTISGIAATLTAEGAAGFAGFYEPGTAFDALSITVATGSGGPSASPSTSVSPSGETIPEASTTPVANSGLPVTGTGGILTFTVVAMSLMAAGTVLLLVSRRRRTVSNAS